MKRYRKTNGGMVEVTDTERETLELVPFALLSRDEQIAVNRPRGQRP